MIVRNGLVRIFFELFFPTTGEQASRMDKITYFRRLRDPDRRYLEMALPTRYSGILFISWPRTPDMRFKLILVSNVHLKGLAYVS